MTGDLAWLGAAMDSHDAGDDADLRLIEAKHLTLGTAYSGVVRYGSTFSFLDDGPEKPIRIWTRIGRRPVLACGNSNGDVPMLRSVQSHPRSLSLLVHHDDPNRTDPPYD